MNLTVSTPTIDGKANAATAAMPTPSPVAPAAKAAAGPTPAAVDHDADASPTPQVGAFNALLASLGLLAPEGTAPGAVEATDGKAEGTEPAQDEDLAAMPAAIALPADNTPVQPAAELTPAWRNDAAMLMASLPTVAPHAASLVVTVAATMQTAGLASSAADGHAIAATSSPAGLQAVTGAAAATNTTSADTAVSVAGAGPAGRAAGVPVASLSVPAAESDATTSSAVSARPALASLPAAATLPRDAAPANDLRDAAATPVRRDEAALAAMAAQPDNGTTAVHHVEAAASVSPASRPVPAHGQALLQALGDRVQVQIAQRSEHAVIRLDPQSMGSVEIVLRHEAGALQVQLSASHPDVQRQLQGISDALRQDLSQRQYTDVSVNVAAQPGDADGRRRNGGQPQPEERPGRALAEAERGGTAGTFSMASSQE